MSVHRLRPDEDPRVRELFLENARILDEFEAEAGRFPRRPAPWLGALLVMLAFVGGGLAYALLLRWLYS